MGAANTGSVQQYYETITWGDSKSSKVTQPTYMSGAPIRIMQYKNTQEKSNQNKYLQ